MLGLITEETEVLRYKFRLNFKVGLPWIVERFQTCQETEWP